MDEYIYEDFLLFFKSLSNYNRQKILFEIFTDKLEHKVSEVADKLNIAVSTASEHLSILKNAGVLESRKYQKEVLYKVNKSKIKEYISLVSNWLTCC